jgi:ABC-type sugar transport system ATPase subunit
VETLPLSTRQLVEIARALRHDRALFVMDEATSALSEVEAERLFSRIDALVRRGKSIVYITHRLEEIYRLADRISVLRDGAHVLTRAAGELSRDELVGAMLGTELARTAAHTSGAGDEPALSVDQFGVADPARPAGSLVDGVSFEVRRGEVLGIAGLRGSGASELLRGLFGGLAAETRGEVRVHGAAPFEARPETSIRHGLVLLTNDRSTSLVQTMNVRENVTLASLDRFSRFGWLDRKREAGAVRSLADRLKLSARSLELPVAALSGGNQQKAALGRCLLTGPRVLLLDEPTRGIDVGARADVYRLIRELGAQGMAVVMFSSELDELMEFCDRILVMCRGRAERLFRRAEFERAAILGAAMGGGSAAR